VIDLDLNQVSVPLAWPDLFGRDAATEIEIGSGKGRFLLELAHQHPQTNYLAVERAAKYHALVCDRVARRGLTNVRMLRTTAEDLLHRLLAPATLQALYVLFPDPWPKKRHHKRRLMQGDNVRAMLAALVPGGRLLVKTDHVAYGEVIDEVLDAAAAEHSDVEKLDADKAFSDLPLTGFESKYRAAGRPIRAFALARSRSRAPNDMR
jgi:tRNA (guanine-N7-)-methyltransferase